MTTGDIDIAPGDAAAGCLREVLSGNGRELLVNHDILSCGPLLPIETLDRWRVAREQFVRTISPEGHVFSFADSERDLLTHAIRLQAAASVTLWVGTGVAEQLLLAWVVEVLRHLNADLGRFRVVQFDRTTKGHEIIGAGVLPPADFHHAPAAIALPERAIDELSRAWAAVTAATPDALLAFLSDAGHPLPFLRRSLVSLLYHYPDVESGLNAWDRLLLQHVRDEGPKATHVVGFTMADVMGFPEWVSDGYLFQRLRRLGDSRLARPFVVLSSETALMRDTEVRLTPDGKAALDGRGHFVQLNGIDEHVAGVHLSSSGGDVWYRDGETLVRPVT